ncbi:MAG: diacylglycerol kinase family protein [Flavobacteriaceae bacterium]|nr:diacylglycerol kinase family protein [Flavobacteriaceae bacterium]
MWNSFLGKRLKAFRYAFMGAFLLIRYEASIQVQTAIAIVMTIAGFYFEISTVEWMFQIFAIGLILSIEGLNTAVEKIADFVHPDFHNKIGFIKDVAAGAVFFTAVTAVIIGCIIYIPKF